MERYLKTCSARTIRNVFWSGNNCLRVPLFREHTCMKNGGYCNFKLKVGAAPMPYWPPVFSQGKGYKEP